jgi:hypothetical protein
MGCLFALMAGAFPRFALFIYWVARPERFDAVFSSFIGPLLGLIFLPFATLMYAILWVPGGLTGWDWCWVVFAGMLDVTHWAVSAGQRNQIPGRQAA